MRKVFICGAHKSGTTLLMRLLDDHPEVFAVPYETHFFRELGYHRIYYNDLKKFGSERRIDTYPFEKTFDSINSTEQNFTQNVRANRFSAELFKTEFYKPCNTEPELFEQLVKAIHLSTFGTDLDPKKVVIEKTVGNEEFVLNYQNMFPEAKFIYILRNPYANLVSLRRFLSKKGRYPYLKTALHRLKMSYSFMMNNFFKSTPNKLIIKYEDLLTNPTETMLSVAEFIGIKYNASLEKPTFLGKEWFGNSSRNYSFTGINSFNRLRWINEIEPFEIDCANKFFRYIFWQFAYDIDYMRKPRKRCKKESLKKYLLNRLLLRGI